MPINGTVSVVPATLTYAPGDFVPGTIVIGLTGAFTFTATSSTAAPTVTAGAGCAIGAGTYNVGLTQVSYVTTADQHGLLHRDVPGPDRDNDRSRRVARHGMRVGDGAQVGTLKAVPVTSQGTNWPWNATAPGGASSLAANGLSPTS